MGQMKPTASEGSSWSRKREGDKSEEKENVSVTMAVKCL